MEASYQLAGEKLQHNVQVLTERNKDHATMLTSHKGRYNRLRETISNIMSRYTTMETKMRHSNMELTEEYKRLTVQYNAMRNKYRQFEIASDSKFKKCWEMNERQQRQLITKLLDADRVIHQQHLGVEWIPPRDDWGIGQGDGLSECGTVAGKSTSTDTRRARFAPSKAKKVFDLIANECNFLVDDMTNDKLRNLSVGEQQVARLHAILESIGVESQDDADLLVSICYKGQDEDDEILYVDGEDVLKLLTEFAEEKENQELADVTTTLASRASSLKLGSESAHDQKERRRREERRFWKKLSQAIPDMNYRVWKVLERMLNKHYQLHQTRSSLIEETFQLHNENSELKRLMDQYLNSSANEELHVPPAHTVRVVAKSDQ
eukprot:GHVT01031751.1.p2 GENE.GHVT01031751.1~~GHVT01031751.1.p2  ORF type:complete len:378 (-),score=25.22 GHVT01031751.1:2640-3773(-)